MRSSGCSICWWGSSPRWCCSCRIDSAAVQGVDLVDASLVAPAAEVGGEEGLHDVAGQPLADEGPAQSQDVGIIVLAGIGGGGDVVAHGGADAGDLVRRHRAAD